MAQPSSDAKDATKQMEEFIAKYNLEAISSELMDEKLSVNELCKKSEDEIDKLCKKLTSDSDQQNALKIAISDKKSKMESTQDVDSDDDVGPQIYIKLLNGKCLSIDVSQGLNEITVKNVKERIESKEGYAQKQQKLVYRGKALDNDNATINDCDIKEGEEIHLVLKSKSDCIIL